MIFTMIVCILVSGASWATTYYVDPAGDDGDDGTSWAEAFATIQKGIDTAANGNVVEVNEGTYYETLDFKGYSVTVQSTDYDDWDVVDKTIIDADGAGTAVTFDTSEDASSVLKGFTITGGDATSGGGVYCDGTSPTITNCIIRGNTATWGGGIDNEFGADPTVTDCVFYDNSAAYGGGLENYYSCAPTVTNCLFFDNAAVDAGDGGGLDNFHSAPTIVNCTFYGNSADNKGGGIANYGASSTPELINCIIWGNAADDANDELHNASSADPNLSYCDVNGCGGSSSWDASFGTDVGGNIDVDPEFVYSEDPNGIDNVWATSDDGLRLGSRGPCIDAGDGGAADSKDMLGRSRVDICGVENTGTGSPAYVDMGAYETQSGYAQYGMEVNSVSADPCDSNCITIVTTGAKYVLTPTDMNMYCRIDVNTNTTFADANVLRVAYLDFNSNIGALSIDWYDNCKAVIESTKATFEFESDSLFFITAKESFSYDHNSVIDAEWNAPLDASDRDANRMWTDGYGGSLHASVSGSPTATDPNTDFTTISMSSGDKTAHMVFPPKSFDFESLYGENARPLVSAVYNKGFMDQLLDPEPGDNTISDYDSNGFGVFVLYGSKMYSNGDMPMVLDSGIMGYEVDDTWETTVRDFIDLAHEHNYKVITYLYVPSLWKYPGGEPQDISVTLAWMRTFQQDYGLDGWYLDSADAGGFLNDYNFMRQVRTDIGDEGIIYHHDSADVWDDQWKPPVNNYEYTGLRAIFVDTYVNYTLTGETGTIAEVDEPNDPYFRFYTCGYGLSQVYGSQLLKSDRKIAIRMGEKGRVLGQNLNAFDRLPENFGVRPSWLSIFKKAYDNRKAEYLNDANVPFIPDVNWPIDGQTGWFRTPTDVSFDTNDTHVTFSWQTNANSDSLVTYTNNSVWDDAYRWRPDGPDSYEPDDSMETQHSLKISRDRFVPGDPYEYRIRSDNGDANIPGQIIWGCVANLTDPNIVGHWKFEEASGSTAYDSAGENDGTIYGGATRSNTGIVGTGVGVTKALDFDGINDYVQISDDDSISLGNRDYSISAWINPDSTSSRRPIAVKTKDANDTEYGFSVILGKLKLDVEKDDNNQYATTTSNVVGTGSWQHVAVTFDASTTTPIFYHNGVSKSSTNTIDTLPDELSDGLYIGTYGTAGTYFNGKIDDVRIFDRVLNANAIEQLYYRDSAFEPKPGDEETGVARYGGGVPLQWNAGTIVGTSDYYDVYLGTDPDSVKNATKSSGEYKGSDTEESYWASSLAADEDYYWRIDENKPNGNVVKGRVWSFRTAP
jgi:hypothetical protein